VLVWHSFLLYGIGLDLIGRSMSWYEGHLATTKGFVKFRKLYAVAGRSDEYGAVIPSYLRHRKQILTKTLREYQHLSLSTHLEFQIDALIHAETAVASACFQGAYDLTIREYCDLAISVVPQRLFGLLDKPVINKERKGDFYIYESLYT
jgi:hypothetical protein